MTKASSHQEKVHINMEDPAITGSECVSVKESVIVCEHEIACKSVKESVIVCEHEIACMSVKESVIECEHEIACMSVKESVIECEHEIACKSAKLRPTKKTSLVVLFSKPERETHATRATDSQTDTRPNCFKSGDIQKN